MKIGIDISGDKQISRQLLRFAHDARDMRPAWSAMVDAILTVERAQFATEGGSQSGGWKPLKPATIAAKMAKGQNPHILQATEALMKSLTVRGAPHQVVVLLPQEMRFGTNRIGSGYHQTGTSRMPRRRVVEFNEATKRRLVKIPQRLLMTGRVR